MADMRRLEERLGNRSLSSRTHKKRGEEALNTLQAALNTRTHTHSEVIHALTHVMQGMQGPSGFDVVLMKEHAHSHSHSQFTIRTVVVPTVPASVGSNRPVVQVLVLEVVPVLGLLCTEVDGTRGLVRFVDL